jgi:hypothetical protein
MFAGPGAQWTRHYLARVAPPGHPRVSVRPGSTGAHVNAAT